MQSDSESTSANNAPVVEPMNTAPSSARSLPGEEEELEKFIKPTFMVIELTSADEKKEIEEALKDIKLACERSITTDLKDFIAKKCDVYIVNKNKKCRFLQCQICGDPYKIKLKQTVSAHVDTHLPFQRFKCPIDGCGAKFYCQNASHLPNFHPDAKSTIKRLAEAKLNDEQFLVWRKCLGAAFREVVTVNKGKWTLRKDWDSYPIKYDSVEQEDCSDDEIVVDGPDETLESVIDNDPETDVNVDKDLTEKEEKAVIKCKICDFPVARSNSVFHYMSHALSHLDFYKYKCSGCSMKFHSSCNDHGSQFPSTERHELELIEFEDKEKEQYETIGEDCFDEIEFKSRTGAYGMKKKWGDYSGYQPPNSKKECKECGFFIHRSDISYHLHSHSKYYRYQCIENECTYKFKSKADLRYHLTDSHEIHDFSKTKCKIRSKNEVELKDLMKKCFPQPQRVQAQQQQ